MKKFILFIIMAMSFSLYALPDFSTLAEALDQASLDKLEEQGDCHRESTREEGLLWLPDHFLGSKIDEIYRELNPKMTVEMVMLVPMDEGISSHPDFIRQVTNKFLNVSDQKGLRYYSSSRKKELTLIEDSFTAREEGSKKKTDDFEFESVPGVTDLVIYQKDVNFGGNYFDYHCELYDEGTLLTTTNRTNLTVMAFFTVAKPDENIMAYALIPCNEGLYIYTAVLVSDPPEQERIFGISVNIQGFFRKRVKKIVEWFSDNFVFL